MKIKSYSALLFSVLFHLTSVPAYTQSISKGISFQGFIKTPTGQLPTVSGTTVLVKVLSPNDCILREETFSNVNILNGYLHLVIGRGTPTSNNPDPARDLKSVMNNSDNFSGLACLLPDGSLNTNKTTYEPQSGDVRKLRVSLQIDQESVIADFNMRAVAYAINAEKADDTRKFGNKTVDEFLQTNSSKKVTQQYIEDWFSNAVMSQILNGNYNAPTATTATTLSTVLPLDKGGTGGTNPAEARANLGLGSLALKNVNGDASQVLYGDGNWRSLPAGNMGTVYSVSAGAGLRTDKPSNAAITNSGELSVDVGIAAGQIVQVQSGGKLPGLDGSQVTNVTAVAVAPSAALEMNKDIKTTENLQAAKAVTAKTFYVFDQVLPSPNSVGLKAPADMAASGGASYVLTLPDRKGAPGQVLAAKDGTGTLEWISPSVGSVTSVQATAPLVVDSTNAASPKVSIPKVTGSVDGYLDKADFASFAAKQPAGNYIVTLQGDVSSSAFTNGTVTTSVDKIKNITITAAPTYNGQVFRMQDGQLQPGFISMLDLRSNVTGALALTATCGTNQTLTFNSATDSLKCENIAIDKAQVAGLGSLAAMSDVDLATADVKGVLPALKGGTGLSALGAAHQLLGMNAAGDAIEYKNLPSCGANQYLTFTGGTLSCANDAGATGTVANLTSGTAALTFSSSTGSVTANIAEASTTAKGLVELATDGENLAGVVVQGNDARLSNARTPTGAAGGDLEGTYPNPTLAVVNSNVGSFGSSTQVVTFTVDAKGRVTAASNVNIAPAFSSLTGKPTDLAGYGITDAAKNNAANTFSVGGQAINNNAAATIPLTIKGAASQSASLLSVTNSSDVALYSLKASGTPTDATDLTTKSYVDTQVAAANAGANAKVSSVAGTAPIAVTPGTDPQVSLNLGAGLEVAANNLTVKYGTAAGTALQGNQTFVGDVIGTVGATTVGKIQGRNVAATAPSNGQVLKWNNTTSAWEPAADVDTDTNTTYTAGTGLALSGTTFNISTVPVANGGTGSTTGSITGTGALTFSAGGANQNVTLTPSGSGFTVLNGNVGIGTATPAVKLEVAGAVISKVYDNGAGTSFNFSLANTQYTSSNCASFTLSNMQDGGVYQIIVKGTTSSTCSFSHSGLTVRMPPSHGATLSGKHTIYSFLRAGSDIYVSWVPGY